MSEKFEPLLHKDKKKTTLKSKTVEVKGVNEFTVDIPKEPTKTSKDNHSEKLETKNKAFRTAKLSPSTILKVNLIQSFFPQVPNGKRMTINDTVSSLVEAYAESNLSERQKETFKQLYNMQYENM